MVDMSERRHKYADMISVSPLLHSWLASAARERIGPLGIASIGPGSTLDHYIFNITIFMAKKRYLINKIYARFQHPHQMV